jgi:hypothetical protein
VEARGARILKERNWGRGWQPKEYVGFVEWKVDLSPFHMLKQTHHIAFVFAGINKDGSFLEQPIHCCTEGKTVELLLCHKSPQYTLSCPHPSIAPNPFPVNSEACSSVKLSRRFDSAVYCFYCCHCFCRAFLWLHIGHSYLFSPFLCFPEGWLHNFVEEGIYKKEAPGPWHVAFPGLSLLRIAWAGIRANCSPTTWVLLELDGG